MVFSRSMVPFYTEDKRCIYLKTIRIYIVITIETTNISITFDTINGVQIEISSTFFLMVTSYIYPCFCLQSGSSELKYIRC